MEVKNSVLGVQGLRTKVERPKSSSTKAGKALVWDLAHRVKGSDDFIVEEGASPPLQLISD